MKPHMTSLLALTIASAVTSPALAAEAYDDIVHEAGAPESADDESDVATREDHDILVTGNRTLTGLKAPNTTASRLDLSPLQTPASIQTLTGAMIRDRGDRSVVEAVTRAAGVSSQATPGNGGNGLSARGFTGVGSVMQLYDGVQMFVGAGTVTFPFDPWTVDRIEVLSGPGSVLYGTGAIGGVVNVVSRTPVTDHAEQTIQLTGGSFGTVRAAVDLTGPITDTLSYRVDLSHNRSDGYVNRGQNNSTALSVKLRLQATDTLSFTLSDDYGHQKPMNYYGIPTVNGKIDRDRRRVNYNITDADIRFDDNWVQFKTEWQVADNITVRDVAYYITANRHWKRVDKYNYNTTTQRIDRTNYLEIYHHQRQYGNHLDASVKGSIVGMENAFSVGSDFNKIRFEHVNNSPYSGSSSTDLYNTDPGTFINLAGTYPRYRTHSTQYSIYAEDRLEVLPGLALAGGIRQDRYEVKRDDLVELTSSSRIYNVTSWRVGSTFEFAKGHVLYAQYAVANDSVGNIISLSAANLEYGMAHGRQVEVGYKAALLDGKAEFTLAAYHIRKNDLLVSDPLVATNTQQVGQQSSKGIEASLALIPIDGIRLEANGTVLKARYDDFAENVGGKSVSRDGNRPTNVPQKTANIWASWQITPEWRVQTGLRYVGKRYTDNANTLVLPPYSVVDAGLRWQPLEGLDVDLRAYNLFDKLYAATSWTNGTTAQWILAKPRSFELSLTGRF